MESSQTPDIGFRGDHRLRASIGMHPSLADSVRRIVRRALRLQTPVTGFEIKVHDEAARLRAGNACRPTDLEIEQKVVKTILNNCSGLASQRDRCANVDTRLTAVDRTTVVGRASIAAGK